MPDWNGQDGIAGVVCHFDFAIQASGFPAKGGLAQDLASARYRLSAGSIQVGQFFTLLVFEENFVLADVEIIARHGRLHRG
jgi:hypothetical protein